MKDITLGDIVIAQRGAGIQRSLYLSVREKIVDGRWQKGSRLPATRALAEYLKISRNSVVAAYHQLQAEGYVDSKAGAGYFVNVDLADRYLFLEETHIQERDKKPKPSFSKLNLTQTGFVTGVPDLQAFPLKTWQQILHRQGRYSLLEMGDLSGQNELRKALCHYLAQSRSVFTDPENIIITVGAQEALTIATLAVLKCNETMLVEEPGYSRVRNILAMLNRQCVSVGVSPHTGLNIDSLSSMKGQALYLTPSNQFPMGTSLNTNQRLAILEWAQRSSCMVIEDDYDSEFQFKHQPYASLQGLAKQRRSQAQVIYVGSFSKVMFNAIRVGYLVVPSNLTARCLEIKDSLSGQVNQQIQAALSEFINDGHLSRHIRKMRKLYQQKHQLICACIDKYFMREGRVYWQVISQSAGLHVTVKWQGNLQNNSEELALVERANQQGFWLRPLSHYEFETGKRSWNGLVLGFGNVPLEQIDKRVKELADMYFQLVTQLSN